MNTAESIAKVLLQEKAVFLRPEEPFTWTSGIKSPVYCDNRLMISTVEPRDFIVNAFCEVIRPLKVDTISGTATAGIPWAAFVAQKLSLPMVYVRSSSKDHGRQNAIEGAIKSGARTVLLEDLISTGKSSIAAAEKLREAGVKVESVLSIFSYDFHEAHKVFGAAQLPFKALCTFDVLAKVAYDLKMLKPETLTQVLEWRKDVKFP